MVAAKVHQKKEKLFFLAVSDDYVLVGFKEAEWNGIKGTEV